MEESKNLISINNISIEKITKILETAKYLEENQDANKNLLNNKVMASLFFESSTRTRLSFDAAMKKLGGNVIGFSDYKNTSVKKGETLSDTIKIVENYSDVIVMRHPLDGSSRYASEISNIPIINAGDGANQHPTQTLLDLYSIKKTQGEIDKIKIALVGDLKHGRTVHSLAQALSRFENITLYLVSPKILEIPASIKLFLKEKNINFKEYDNIEAIINQIDILYMTRIQKERFDDLMEYEKIKSCYTLNKKMLENVKDNLKILHPLPRVDEITVDVDNTKYAYYFQQAHNGLYIRQAILALTLEALK